MLLFLSTWVLLQHQTLKQQLLKVVQPGWSQSTQTIPHRLAAQCQVPACEQGKSCSAPLWLLEGKLMPAPSHRKRTCLPGLGCVGWEGNSTGTKNSSFLGLFQEDSLPMTAQSRNYYTERTAIFEEVLFNGIM